jgi:hypothetical protein
MAAIAAERPPQREVRLARAAALSQQENSGLVGDSGKNYSNGPYSGK